MPRGGFTGDAMGPILSGPRFGARPGIAWGGHSADVYSADVYSAPPAAPGASASAGPPATISRAM
jgi:hypothetical protein